MDKYKNFNPGKLTGNREENFDCRVKVDEILIEISIFFGRNNHRTMF